MTVLLLAAGAAPTVAEEARVLPRAGDAFDAVPFGFADDAGPNAWGVRWAEPRKIRRVVVEFDGQTKTPSPDKVRLEYWHASWDAKPEPIQSEKGAGGVGWERMDDWTNGQWKQADTRLDVRERTWTFTFAPTGEKEFPASAPGVTYRKTLKLRLVADGDLPRPMRLAAFTDAVYEPLTVRVLFGKPANPAIHVDDVETGHLGVFNGTVSAVRPVNGAAVTGNEWKLPALADNGIEADILAAVDRLNPEYDRTIVTVRSRQRPFSFAADEAARGDRILVDDLGVLVVRADDPITLEDCRQYRKEFAGRTIYSRVFDKPEQTLAHAWEDMPLKRPLYFVHGLPGNRNSMHQNGKGMVSLTGSKRWFQLPPSSKDTPYKKWAGDFLELYFGFPEDHHVHPRELKRGYLPMLTSWYRDGVLSYEQTTVLDKLDGALDDVALDDPTVLLMRVRIVNTSATQAAAAGLFLTDRAENKPEPVFIKGDRVFATWEGKPCLRYVVRGLDRGTIDQQKEGVRWSMTVAPNTTHDLYFLIPSITMENKGAIAALGRRDFEADAARVCGYWDALIGRGCTITTPEPWLNDFYKAHLQHLLVNCYKEIGSDRLYAHVGTFGYGAYPDESVMMISDLDRRGYHDEARRCYQAFLDYQGTVEMPGNFKSKEGTLYGSGGHEDGGYNKSHAWVMWGLAEHWRYTRDKAWMEKAAPKLIAACDWVIRERGQTMQLNKDGTRPLEYGFLPTGSLEDVTDYWSWLVTNACTDWGFQALSSALAEYGHPEAARLQREAQAFHEDLMRGFEESRTLAPVVRLRDGTYVPKYPSRLYERGRTHGWLRETLEGSIHLLITGLLDPRSPQADWILKDFEDNLYVSEGYGYAIPVFNEFWFSRGGFSMQANLLGGPLPYLDRDEVKHFLRAYFNSFASAFYPDIRMFNEHSLPELGYPAGDHYKTSDEAQSTYWLRLMFVHEQGGDLYLGQAIPRYWLADGKVTSIERASTHYGPVSLRIESHVGRGEIHATLDRSAFPAQPRTIYLRLRHPDQKRIKEVLVNGKPHDRFDADKEWIVLPGDTQGHVEVLARY
jgi:hypothetical protein